MNKKQTISLTQARRRIFDIAEKVQEPDTHYTLTEKGRPKAVIMSAEEYESLMETLEVQQDFPGLEEDMETSKEELRRGNYIPLEKILQQHGFVIADKGKEKYAPRRRKSKGRKSAK